MENHFDEQDRRIASVFSNETKDHSKREQTLEIYKRFLEEKLTFPVKLTGMEDFSWEEFYVFGPGDEAEYKELKKTRPSYSDVYNLVRIEDFFEEDIGLMAKVTRISDKKRFHIPLGDLEPRDEKSENYELLTDYSSWNTNS